MLSLKTILILFIQINLFLFLGSFSSSFLSKKDSDSVFIGQMICTGFIVYHSFFWMLAFPWALFDLPFKSLAIIWLTIIVILIVLYLFITRNYFLILYRSLFIFVKNNIVYISVSFSFLWLIVFLSTRNGFWDIDSQTYIGEVTTILGTDHIMSINPTTGLPLARSLFLRRGCSLFGAESAFWCYFFNLHPLIYCKIVRAALNPILLAFGAYSVLRLIHYSAESALIFTIFSCPAFLLFDNSGYTNTRFLLHRGYEGKAYLSGTLIVITILICIIYIRAQSRISFILLLLNEIAALSISASSLYLIPPILISVLGAYIITKKEWNKIPLLLVLIVPNAVFALLQAIG